jgi:hypothetical protein
LALSPLLKLLNRVTVLKCFVGYTVESSGPYSVAEFPPNVLVPGMNGPPCCQMHVPLSFPVVKIG